jgi:hypothetical protein
LKSSTSVGGNAGAPFGPSRPDAARSTRSVFFTSSFSVPIWSRTVTTPGTIFGWAGDVRVTRARKASRRVAGSVGAPFPTSAGLQTAIGFTTSTSGAPVASKRSRTIVPGRGTNAGTNAAFTGAPL